MPLPCVEHRRPGLRGPESAFVPGSGRILRVRRQIYADFSGYDIAIGIALCSASSSRNFDSPYAASCRTSTVGT
jgi:hypothetical protein